VIIVLEGLNGVGKSAVAKILVDVANRSTSGGPAVGLRPWRRNPDQHLGRDGDTFQAELRSLGVPANTYVDDLYVADFLAATQGDAVLDRSIASGIAYGMLYGDLADSKKARGILRMWESLLENANPPFLYVYMCASGEVRQKRCGKRWNPNKSETSTLEKWFDLVFKDVQMPKFRLDTSEVPTPKHSALKILKRIQDA